MKNSIIKRVAIFSLCLITVLFINCGHKNDPDKHTHNSEDTGHVHTHAFDERGDGHSHYDTNNDKPPFTYLRMNGEFHLNPGDSLSQNDPRNPGRLKLTTSDKAGSITKMVFYDHNDLDKKLAECGYEFIGSRPDPHFYPKKSKTSIWDVFKKVKDFSGDCINYNYVISRSPHGDTIHMHLRYGDDVEALLAMSNDTIDSQFNPWWGVYCDIERTTSCD
ncbi:hypothetical protein KO500_16095 [Cellulophaga baltica]|uniref:hypothetical protein n=1 Tax=Cellulophaga TaxID=104264 RepID=UPI001C07E71E|nr:MULTISPECIES: hypothetical protein [Cellulophaga]MBU2997964.1 hypothetical protein [Cellulophaga baltica]MDO6769365.1 hypothetical protein [Cellulophaga sp. 1_MG-2023]